MVYSPANSPRSGQPNTENNRLRGLFAAVAVLGLASYGLSFGPVIDGAGTGWYVRFAALAGLVAAFGLLPKSKPLPLVTAVLAAMGFLDGLSTLITADMYGWALTVIVVLNALQAAVAVAALLLGPKAEADTTTAGYEAYVDYYNQAVRNYYSQQAQSAPPEQAQHSAQAYAHGQGYADAQSGGQVRRTQRPSQYGDYAELDYTPSRPGAPAHHQPGGGTAQAAGMPSVGHTQGSEQRPQHDYDQSAWPSSPP